MSIFMQFKKHTDLSSDAIQMWLKLNLKWAKKDMSKELFWDDLSSYYASRLKIKYTKPKNSL